MATRGADVDTTATRTGTAEVRGGTARYADDRLVSDHTETRRSFATTEFWLTLIASAVIMISAYADEQFNIEHGWTLVAVIVVGYLLSRGLAKAGSREHYIRSRDDL
jgi:hypothetical protein